MQTYVISVDRLRNLTTQRLHTEMGDIYRDLETLSGETGLMTHMLPRVMDAVTPWLRAHPQLQGGQWWDDEFRQHGDVLPPVHLTLPTAEERAKMWASYGAMPNPLAGKQVIVVGT
jgi:hypothetical protein